MFELVLGKCDLSGKFPGYNSCRLPCQSLGKIDLHIDGGISLSKPWITSAPKVVRNNENQYYTNFPVIIIKTDMKLTSPY